MVDLTRAAGSIDTMLIDAQRPALILELYDRYRPLLVHIARERGLRGDEVDDALQEVLLAAAMTTSEVLDWRSWLAKTMCHKIADHWRETKPAREATDVVELACAPTAEVAVELSETRSAFGKLTATERSILILRFEERLSVEQIAELEGIASDTVYSRIHKARKHLRELLDMDSSEQQLESTTEESTHAQ